jgi:hypothetical protein
LFYFGCLFFCIRPSILHSIRSVPYWYFVELLCCSAVLLLCCSAALLFYYLLPRYLLSAAGFLRASVNALPSALCRLRSASSSSSSSSLALFVGEGKMEMGVCGRGKRRRRETTRDGASGGEQGRAGWGAAGGGGGGRWTHERSMASGTPPSFPLFSCLLFLLFS